MAPKAMALGGLVGLVAATAGVSYAQQPVRIDSVSVEAEVVGRIARSRVTYVLRNDTGEDAEGIFELELPNGAALLRLAMDTRPGQMMEGEIESPEKARKIYETIVARKLDPALVEHIAGDRYRLRAFPVPARDRKTVLLVFDHRVERIAGKHRYELTLPSGGGRPSRVRRVSGTIRADGRLRARIRRANTAEPIALSWRPRRERGVVTTRIRNETWFSADLLLPGRSRSGWTHLVAAVDTSSSVSEVDHRRIRSILERLIAATPRGGSIDIALGATELQRCRGRRALGCFDRARRGGATDLGGLIDAAATRAARLGDGVALVLLTDGKPSVGQRSISVLAKGLAARLERSGVKLVAVELGRDDDEESEHEVAELVSVAGGAVVEPSPRRVLRALAPIEVTGLEVAGSHMLSTREATAGATVTIVGKLPLGRETGVVEVSGWRDGRARRWQIAIDRSAARSPSVEGVWVRAKLRAMQAAGASSEALAALAKTHGVAGVGSSMLVLETEHDYKRWAIARTQGAIVSRRAKPPQVRIGCACVASGSIDKYLIRDTMRRRHRQLRHCYNRALIRRPDLEGTIVAGLLIKSWTGELAASHIASSSIGDAAMEACVAKQLTGLKFPVAKGGGLVVVRYPFRFRRPEATAVEKAIARRERIREIEAGEASARRPRQIGELVRLYDAEGDNAKAAATLALLERQLKAAGRSQADLLAALETPRLRRRFAATFRRAARARLRQPSAPTDLFGELLASVLRDEPETIGADFDTLRPASDNAARAIDQLVAAGRSRLAVRLIKSWRASKLYSTATLYGFLAQEGPARALPALLFDAAARLGEAQGSRARYSFGHLVGAARTTADLRRAGAIIRAHCKKLEDTDDACMEWLDKLATDPSTARHRKRLLSSMLRAIERDPNSDDHWSEIERAKILERLGRASESLAIVEERLEAEPDNDDVRDRYVRLRAAVGVRKR